MTLRTVRSSVERASLWKQMMTDVVGRLAESYAICGGDRSRVMAMSTMSSALPRVGVTPTQGPSCHSLSNSPCTNLAAARVARVGHRAVGRLLVADLDVERMLAHGVALAVPGAEGRIVPVF